LQTGITGLFERPQPIVELGEDRGPSAWSLEDGALEKLERGQIGG